jgi:hypothetical protein
MLNIVARSASSIVDQEIIQKMIARSASSIVVQ